MSPRTLVVSILMMAACLLLAVVLLAMLNVESDQSMLQEPPEFFAREGPRSPTVEPCEEPAPQTQLAEVPPGTAWIPQC